VTFGSEFLRDPRRFPAGDDGAPDGDHALCLAFARGRYRVHGLHAAGARRVRERYGPLCVEDDGDAAIVDLRLRRLPAADFVPIDPRGWTFHLDLAHAPDRVRFAGRQICGQLSVPARHGTLWTCVERDDELLEAVENLFRFAVAYHLHDRGGVLLHSAGVLAHGRASVFFGASNSGKTTLARRCREAGYEVLSDELNALWRDPQGGGVRVEKLPFAGELGLDDPAPRSAPCAGLYRLRQGPRSRVAPLPPARAVGMLVAAAPFVNADPLRLDRLLDGLGGLARAVRVATFTYALDDAFHGVLRGGEP